MIAGFRDDFRFLSNFYNAPVTYNGVTYKNSEAAFQAAKFLHLTPDDIRAKVSPSIIDGYGFDLTNDHCVEHAFAAMSAADAKKLLVEWDNWLHNEKLFSVYWNKDLPAGDYLSDTYGFCHYSFDIVDDSASTSTSE